MIFIVEAFFSGCISKVINDGKDYSWFKIKSVVKDRHDQNISTKICRVIEKALNIVTEKKYKDSDDIYDAIEKIFNEFKNHSDSLQSVKCGLSVLGTDISDQRCENFLEIFYEGIRRDDDLYKAVMMDLEQKDIKINQEGFRKINEKLDRNHREIVEKLYGINVSNNGEKVDARKLKFQNNKKQDYIKNWNNRLFLHIDNDENPITLADAFIMPDYKIYKSVKRMGFSSEDTLDKLLDKFVKYGKTSTMLITGVPGMGKTSITSWIAQKYENDTNYIILRFRDWEPDELNNGVLKAICNTLKCMKRDLHSKVIILDGFDEIKESDRRDFLLYGFLNEINDFECLKVIITSRSSYIDWAPFFNVIELISFGIAKITKFYQLITGEKMSENNIDISNVDILGIPVILYMSIMADIDLTVKTTRPKLYDNIFAEKGGIFDKFCVEGIGYDKGLQPLRDIGNVRKYLKFLQNVAYIMFEKNKLSLNKDEYHVPELEFQGERISIIEFPIKPFFESNGYNIEFIHKSICDYFISEYFFSFLREALNVCINKEELAEILGNMFITPNRLEPDVLIYLRYKIKNSDLNYKFDFIDDAFQLMLINGMTYYIKEHPRNIMKCEINIFVNMLDILHLWERDFWRFHKSIHSNYFLYNMKYGTNLAKAQFAGVHLNCARLHGADLREANLENTDLSDADLEGANLEGANLRGTILFDCLLGGAKLTNLDLRETNLIRVDLGGIRTIEADLEGSILNEEQVSYLALRYHLQGVKVYIETTRDIVEYEEYCKNNKK